MRGRRGRGRGRRKEEGESRKKEVGREMRGRKIEEEDEEGGRR